MRGIEALQSVDVSWNSLTCVLRGNEQRPLEVYRFLRGIGSRYMQFIPIVERRADVSMKSQGLNLAPPPSLGCASGDDAVSTVTPWSVGPEAYGHFMITIFDRWVRNDVGRIFIQLHDNTLAKWIQPASPGLCVFEETCGKAVALEHDGSVYACDHFVYADHLLGNIHEQDMASLVNGPRQRQFGYDKRDKLPKQCLECPVKVLCNGGCPKERFMPDRYGNPGLNYLCQGYLEFFTKTAPYMRKMSELYEMKRSPADVMQLVRNGLYQNNLD